MSDVSEKLLELQEHVQKLQLLRQLGAEKLILEQENEVYKIQQEIMDLDSNASVALLDFVPQKCRFCPEQSTDEAKLECFEANNTTCKRKPPSSVGFLNLNILKVILQFVVMIGVLVTFLILTNIFINYFPDDRLLVLLLSASGLILVVLIFRKPVKSLFHSI